MTRLVITIFQPNSPDAEEAVFEFEADIPDFDQMSAKMKDRAIEQEVIQQVPFCYRVID